MENAPDVTRREFLKTATAVAAASALPGVGAPALLATPSPNEVVNYGFIGTGTQGCFLLKNLSTIPQGRCLCTCDIYPPNLKKGVETIGGNPQTYDDYHRLLERKDVDAVMIATPLNLHAQMVIDALNAGKHVFVEKCMFFKEEEGEKIRQAAEAHPKQVLQVGLQRRSSLLYQVAMAMIRQGALGRITFVRAQWHRNSSWRRPVSDPKFERFINWRMYREYSGGLMAELASHQIDVANWAIGATPIAVLGTGGIDYWKDGRETNDNVEVIFVYPGGQKMVFTGISSNAHYNFSEQIMGDRGTIEITIGKGVYFRETVAKVTTGASKENWWAGATVSKEATQEGSPIFPDAQRLDQLGFIDREVFHARRWLATLGMYDYTEPHDPVWQEMYNYLASIREGKPIAAPFQLGADDAYAVIYANRAIDTGQKVLWPKKTSLTGELLSPNPGTTPRACEG
jgi:predicted dehydrogenase